MIGVSAICAGVAYLLWRPPGRWVAARRLGHGARVHAPTRAAWVVAAVCASAVGTTSAGLSLPRLVLVVTAGAVAAFTLRQVRAERRRGAARQRRDAVAESVGLMAAELRAGILPPRVLGALAPDFPFLAPAARAADLGGDIAAALRDASAHPGSELLAALSGAWWVAERSGAPVARVLDRLVETARDDREIEREVQAGVGPARATGRLMAALPVMGLLLGSGFGADPVSFLTGTLAGSLCLAAGSAFACLGVAWINKIASTTERLP